MRENKRKYEPNRYESGATFVPAIRDPAPPRTVYVDPAEIVTLPPAAMTTTETTGTHVDKAKAFQVATLPVAVGFGLGALILAVAAWSVPVLSVAALLVFWAAFLVWWLLGWLVYHLFSADGLALLHVVLGWRYLSREQKERHRRYKQ